MATSLWKALRHAGLGTNLTSRQVVYPCSGQWQTFAPALTAARLFGIDWRTVDRTLKSSIPPGHRRGRRVKRPKPDAPAGIIAAILDVDRTIPGKQEHTSKRVFERLRDEHGHGGGITVVQDRILAAKRRRREMFVPSSRPPGHAPADPGEAPGVIGGVERKIHLPVMMSRSWPTLTTADT